MIYLSHGDIPHHLLPTHCGSCGVDWPKDANSICPSCKSGLACRADTTDPVNPDPPCEGSKLR
jgi:hypothetical protein